MAPGPSRNALVPDSPVPSGSETMGILSPNPKRQKIHGEDVGGINEREPIDMFKDSTLSRRAGMEDQDKDKKIEDLTRQLETSKQRALTLENSLSVTIGELEARREANRANTDTAEMAHAHYTSQLEESSRQLEQQKRRAFNFEASLRVAQEAIQRQRTQAQETEARQQITTERIAKELQDKEQHTTKLANEVSEMGKRIEELTKSLSEREAALNEERDESQRTRSELERVQQTVSKIPDILDCFLLWHILTASLFIRHKVITNKLLSSRRPVPAMKRTLRRPIQNSRNFSTRLISSGETRRSTRQCWSKRFENVQSWPHELLIWSRSKRKQMSNSSGSATRN
jgi:myosin heavy subunit